MAETVVFDWLCAALERETTFSRLEARGTVRIALRDAGLDAGSVTRSELAVLLDRTLPIELASRGVEGATALCESLAGELAQVELAEGVEGAQGPEAVFSRLGGD